jgi:secretion/DNA translocation related TadE-like protein
VTAGFPAEPERKRERERGAVSMLMLALLVMGLVLVLAAARLGTALSGRAHAESAADAAALAAADALALGRGSAAAEDAARTVAERNDAHLVSCACSGTSAEVVVEVDLVAIGHAQGHARAVVEATCLLPGRC